MWIALGLVALAAVSFLVGAIYGRVAANAVHAEADKLRNELADIVRPNA